MSTIQNEVQSQFKQGVKWLSGAAILAGISIGGWLIYGWSANQSPDAVQARLVKVNKDTVEETINESGVVELGDQQTLKAPTDSIVEQVLVQVGQNINAGQKLIILRDPERQTKLTEHQIEIDKQQLQLETQRQAVRLAEEQLTAAQDKQQSLRAQYRLIDQTRLNEQKLKLEEAQLTIANLQAQVRDAQADLDAEQQKLTKDEELYERGFIAENEVLSQTEAVRNAQAQLRNARLEVSKAQLNLQTLELERQRSAQQITQDTADLEAEIATAQAQIRASKSELQQAQIGVDEASLDLKKLQVAEQKITQELAANIVTAPSSGIVLDLQTKKGDVLKQSETTLLTIGNPAQETVKLQLSTLNAEKVAANQTARISVIGPQETTFFGKVQTIARQASTGDENQGRGNREATVLALVKLDKPSGTLIPGSQVNVEIIIQARKNVPVVSIEAIQQPDKQPFVWVLDEEGKTQKREIKLGLEGLTTVEVTSGLQVGEQVVLSEPDTPLASGVEIIEE